MPGDIIFPFAHLRTHRRFRRKFASARAICALILREISTSYGRAPGGYLWAIVEPAAAIALLTTIFALGLHAPPIGQNFALFYATGMLPFAAFSNISTKIAAAINYSKALLAYPSVTYIDAILGRFSLNILTEIIVSLIIITSLLMIYDTRITPELPQITFAFFLTAILALGIGTLNCFLTSMYPLWQRVWSVITRPLFLVSGTLFILEIVPQPYRDVLWYNPVIHVVSMMRAGFYPGYNAPWASPLYVMLISGISFTIGLVFLHRYHRDILHR